MRKTMTTVLLALALTGLGSSAARADGLRCTMVFTMQGWSAFYARSTGVGTIHCSDGRSMRVRLIAKGGGPTVGESAESGRGEFSPVASLADLLGSYVDAQAHAGAGNSGQVLVVTKGTVSLALSAKGHGWDLGVVFGELKIER